MNALPTDLYPLTMLDAYLREGMDEPAVFELFVRRRPPQRQFRVAAGLEQALDFLESLAFDAAELDWLARQGGSSPRLLEYLGGFRFQGEVHAMPEGTIFFADEPVLRVTAPLPQAQLVESRMLNIVHVQTLIASKAALFAARAAYLAGFIGGARLDSGDLARHARVVRGLLDDGGLQDVTVFASGNLDEQRITDLLAAGAPIDGFGVGTALDTSSDAPALDAVYMLQSYAGVARRKRCEGKATWPGAKQVCRRPDAQGRMAGDIVQRDDEAPAARPLLQPVMRSGRRLGAPSLAEIRSHHAAQRAALPSRWCGLEAAPTPYPVEISAGVRALARQLDGACPAPAA